MIEWNAKSTENTSFFIKFEKDNYTSRDRKTLSNIFQNEYSVGGIALSGGYYFKFVENSPAVVGLFNGSTNRNRWFVLEEGRYFNSEEEAASSPSAILSRNLFPEGVFDLSQHKASYLNQELTVVGLSPIFANNFFIGMQDLYRQIAPKALQEPPQYMSSYHDLSYDKQQELERQYKFLSSVVVIPYSLFQSMDLVPQLAVLSFNELSASNRNSIFEELKMLFPKAEVHPSLTAEQALSFYTQNDLRYGVLLSIVSVVFIMAMLYYWLDVSYNTQWIMYKLGCAKGTIRRLNIMALLIVLLIAYGISLALSCVLESYFKSLLLSLKTPLHYHLYLILFLIFIVIICVISGQRFNGGSVKRDKE